MQQNMIGHGANIDRRSPTMMKGAETQSLSSQYNYYNGGVGSNGITAVGGSPALVHHQDLSSVIVANSQFRYDDSANANQKARNNTALSQHQNQNNMMQFSNQ